jgi:hypothetical protein
MVLAEATHDGHGVIQLSDDGFKAIRDVSMARLAIFEGAPKEAEKRSHRSTMPTIPATRRKTPIASPSSTST